jgi:hypothetical protein
MHATITHTRIDMDRLDEAVGGIDAVEKRLRSLAGFRGGYWMEPIDGQGLMVGLWDTEENATAAAPSPGFSPAPGVTVERVEIREIIHHA